MVRRIKGKLIRYVPVPTQLTWCKKSNIPKAIFTHCGSEIVAGDERKIKAKLRNLASERNVDVDIAHDGMKVILR